MNAILIETVYNVHAKNKLFTGFLVLWAVCLQPTVLTAQLIKNWELAGYSSVESRWFIDGPLDSRQESGLGISLSIELELYRAWNQGDFSFTFKPFIRLDSEDTERTHFDIRELYVQKISDNWELKAGVGKVFWGVIESQHLVDMINQTDLIENLDREEKLGQPMVNVTWISKVGDFDFFLLPYFRERTFPGIDGRLRNQAYVYTDRPLYESDAEAWHPDLALRWSHVLGDFDLGLYYFYGTSHDPLFQLESIAAEETVLRPVYNLMQQSGLDAQLTHGGWLLKFEGLARSGKGQHYQAFASGFEYTFYGLLDTSIDVGLLSEYHYDSRGDDATTLFNQDIFAGMRITLNDTMDTAFLGGVFYDHDNGSTAYRVEFERRLGDRYKLLIEGQKFSEAARSDLAYNFRHDSFLQIEFRRYF